MPKINTYQQRTSINNLGPRVNARGQNIVSALGDAAPRLQGALRDVQEGINSERQVEIVDARFKQAAEEKLKRQEENDAIVWSGSVLSDAHLRWTQHMVDAKNSVAPGAPGFTPQFLADFDKFKGETIQNAPTDAARKYLTGRLEAMRVQFGQAAINFEATAKRDYRVNTVTETINNNAKLVQDDPGNFETVYAETLATIEALDIPPNEKIALANNAKAAIPYATVLGNVQRDPQGMADRLRGTVSPVTPTEAKRSFKSVMDVIFDIEGGYNEDDGNGPVNFGINQAANPDLDVKNITKDQATKRYKERYWDAIDGDSLPPNVALMAMDTAVNQGVSFAKSALKESGGNVGKMAAIRRDKYDQLIRDNPKRYAKYNESWENRVALIEEKSQRLGSSQGLGGFDLSSVTSEDVKSAQDPAINALSFDQRIKLISHAETLGNRAAAVAKENLRGKMQDFEAMASAGVPLSASVVPSVSELVEAYGQADGLRIFNDDIKPMVVLNGDMQRFSTMSVDERRAVIQQRDPVPGDGYLSQAKRQAIMIQANEALIKEMSADPAAYAIKYSPEISQEFENLQNAEVKPAAAAIFANASLAEQKRLGVKDPVILPKVVADQIVRQFHSQAEGGQNAALMIQDQAETWGNYWPQVYGQLAKDLPSSALVIGSGIEPGAAELLARGSTLTSEQLKEGLDPTAAKDIDLKMAENLRPFMQSMNDVAGGERTYTVFSEQAKNLALMYARTGMGANMAADKAFNAVIGDKYDFVTNTNNTNTAYRVPKQYDAAVVSSIADKYLSQINVDGLQIPASLYGLDLEQSKEAYQDALREHAYWITSPKEDGLALYANGAAVLRADGTPIIKVWDEFKLKPGENNNNWVRDYDANKPGFL